MLSPKAFAFRYRGWVVGAAVLGALILLYSLLVENAVLVGFVVVAWLFGLFVAAYVAYLLYHFVHSVSRIADALEDDTPITVPGDGGDADPGGDADADPGGGADIDPDGDADTDPGGGADIDPDGDAA